MAPKGQGNAPKAKAAAKGHAKAKAAAKAKGVAKHHAKAKPKATASRELVAAPIYEYEVSTQTASRNFRLGR